MISVLTQVNLEGRYPMSEVQIDWKGYTSPPSELIDATYLSANIKNAQDAVRKALHHVSYFRDEIASLQTQVSLPVAYQDAYHRLFTIMDEVCKVISGTRDQVKDFQLENLDLLTVSTGEIPADLVGAAREVTIAINQAEDSLLDEIRRVQSSLITKNAASKIDWSMPFDFTFTLLLNPGPERAFYDTCGDGGEPLRIDIRPYCVGRLTEKDINNWNVFRHDEEHPLKGDFHGYLMRCITDHWDFTWQLLPYIKEVEVNVEFSDFESAWINPHIMESCEHK